MLVAAALLVLLNTGGCPGPDQLADLGLDVDARVDVPADVSADVPADVRADVPADVPADVTVDAGPEQPDSVSDSHVGQDVQPDAGADATAMKPCTTAEQCDDGDPLTMDMCYQLQGVCFWVCDPDSACDDGDPLTWDECKSRSDGMGTFCDHPYAAGRCGDVGDCADDLACTTETCDAQSICQHEWTGDCGLSMDEPYPACSAGATAGGLCCDGPTCTTPCRFGGPNECPRLLECTFMPSGPDRWSVLEPAGPACPGGPCPSAPPAWGTPCADEGLRCNYDPRPAALHSDISPVPSNGLGPECACVGGQWECKGSLCPLLPPADGETLDKPSWWSPSANFYASCSYLGRECSVVTDGGAYAWHCVIPIACPKPAPATGDTCMVGADDHCSYSRTTPDQPVTTYTGDCSCEDNGEWSCDPSASTDCPAILPSGPCENTVGTGQCIYYGDSGGQWCNCQPVDLVDYAWSCWDI